MQLGFVFLFFFTFVLSVSSMCAAENGDQGQKQKVAVILAGYGSGNQRYVNNVRQAAESYLKRGYKVFVVSDFQSSPEYSDPSSLKVFEQNPNYQILNTFNPDITKQKLEQFFDKALASHPERLEVFVTGHGFGGYSETPLLNYLQFNHPKEPISISHQEVADSLKRYPATTTHLIGVQCYSSINELALSLSNACSGSATDPTAEHTSTLSNAPYSYYLYNVMGSPKSANGAAADYNGDRQISYYEAHAYGTLNDDLNRGMNLNSSGRFLAQKFPQSFFSTDKFIKMQNDKSIDLENKLETLNKLERDVKALQSCSQNKKACESSQIPAEKFVCDLNIFETPFFLNKSQVSSLESEHRSVYEHVLDQIQSEAFLKALSKTKEDVQKFLAYEKELDSLEQVGSKMEEQHPGISELSLGCLSLTDPNYKDFVVIGELPSPQECKDKKSQMESYRSIRAKKWELQGEKQNLYVKLYFGKFADQLSKLRLLNDLYLEGLFKSSPHSESDKKKYKEIIQCESQKT